MILFLSLISCSQEPFVFKRKMNQCRMISSISDQNVSGPSVISKTTQIWTAHQDGERADFKTISEGEETGEGYQIYNKQGFLIESYLDYDKNRLEKELIEYDCSDEWCWRKRSHKTTMSYGSESVVEYEYDWKGKTEFYKLIQGDDSIFGQNGKIVYNEYYYPVQYVHQYSSGYSEEKMEYDCLDGWCKISHQEGQIISIEERPKPYLPHSIEGLKMLLKEQLREREYVSEKRYVNNWTLDRLDWERDEGQGYTVHNKYGYPIEDLTSFFGIDIHTKATYDCGEEQ